METFCGLDGYCGWEMVGHIVHRFLLHMALGGAVAIGSLLAWSELSARGFLWRLRGVTFFVLPALISVFAISLREAFDVARGDPALKSMFDVASWLLGVGLWELGIYRLIPRLRKARNTIQNA